jgi:hypothetical protein
VLLVLQQLFGSAAGGTVLYSKQARCRVIDAIEVSSKGSKGRPALLTRSPAVGCLSAGAAAAYVRSYMHLKTQ